MERAVVAHDATVAAHTAQEFGSSKGTVCSPRLNNYCCAAL